MSNNHNSAGKGSRARNNFSSEFRDNYDEINWGGAKSKTVTRKQVRKGAASKRGVQQ